MERSRALFAFAETDHLCRCVLGQHVVFYFLSFKPFHLAVKKKKNGKEVEFTVRLMKKMLKGLYKNGVKHIFSCMKK